MKWTFWTRTLPAGADDCGTIDPLLFLYSDGMASTEEGRRVEMHLLDCTTCRESLAWMQATQRALSARPVASPPADLRARIASAIAASSAEPVPALFQVRPARAFPLRPAYAAAASLTVLGAVAVSYGLLHVQTPTAKHSPSVSSSRQVAGLPSVGLPATIAKPPIGPGVRPHVLRHSAATPKSASLNPDLVAQTQREETQPELTQVKTPAEALHAAKASVPAGPLVASSKPRPSAIKKVDLPKPRPELMAKNHGPANMPDAHKPLLIQPETKKADTIVATASPAPKTTAPTLVEKTPVITSDPAPTVVVASSHDSHPPANGLLSLSAYVGQMKGFTHSTIGRTDKGMTLATHLIDQGKTPSIDINHGSF